MGTNSAQAFTMVQEGLGLVRDFQHMTSNSSSGDEANEETAKLRETEAKRKSWETRRHAENTAEDLRSARERGRSRRSAGWGGSNLAMSGSKELVQDADRIKDRQDEEDVLFEGAVDADSVLQDGRNNANMLRINSGGSPKRSILSMGSKIYGTGR
nr:hypothetical protein [uncultured Pseudodesulfovibrio sp.]